MWFHQTHSLDLSISVGKKRKKIEDKARSKLTTFLPFDVQIIDMRIKVLTPNPLINTHFRITGNYSTKLPGFDSTAAAAVIFSALSVHLRLT